MSGEKTEEPTDTKLQEARKKGEVPKSQDTTMAFSMLGVCIALMLLSSNIMEHLRLIVNLGLKFGGADIPVTDLYRRIGEMVIEALFIVVPLLVVAGISAAIGIFSHVGLVISMEPVMPKPEKVDPAAGLKKIFSVKSVVTFLQMLFKAIVLGAVLWNVITQLIPLIAAAAYQSVDGIGVIAWEAIKKIFSYAVALFMVLGPLDYGIQRWQFMKGQKMSKDDVKREFKNQEGDPEVKGQRKQLAEEIVNSDPKKSVAGANAIIVNPTHYAVAVKYTRDEIGLPIIVAKGLDDEAMLIRAYADEFGIPIFSNPPLARALYKVPLNDCIPEEAFEAVAIILRWVEDVGVQGNTSKNN
jgi:type III secretion protein U